MIIKGFQLILQIFLRRIDKVCRCYSIIGGQIPADTIGNNDDIVGAVYAVEAEGFCVRACKGKLLTADRERSVKKIVGYIAEYSLLNMEQMFRRAL